MEEGFHGLPDTARFVDWRMPRSYRSGVAEGGRFPNLITFHYCDPCPTLREEISATDSNYATADDDNVAIS